MPNISSFLQLRIKSTRLLSVNLKPYSVAPSRCADTTNARRSGQFLANALTTLSVTCIQLSAIAILRRAGSTVTITARFGMSTSSPASRFTEQLDTFSSSRVGCTVPEGNPKVVKMLQNCEPANDNLLRRGNVDGCKSSERVCWHTGQPPNRSVCRLGVNSDNICMTP